MELEERGARRAPVSPSASSEMHNFGKGGGGSRRRDAHLEQEHPFKGSRKHSSLWKLRAHYVKVNPSVLAIAISRQAAQGCFAEKGYSLLSASFTPEWRTQGNSGSAKHSTVTISRKFSCDSSDLQ